MRQIGLLVLLISLIGRPASAWDGRELVRLAREAVCAEIEGTPLPQRARKTLSQPVFVTIECKGKVLGCRGGLVTRQESLEAEVIAAARSAARHDPRYRPLTRKDIEDFQVTVTVVGRMEPIENINSLMPGDGLVLRSGSRTGIVLPWEGKDPKIRLQWAYKKAGLAFGSACKLYRLKAERIRG